MRIGAIAFGLLLSGCAMIPLEAPAYLPAPEAPAGFSNIYLYRKGAYPALRSPVINIDGKRVLSPPEGSYSVLPLAVGVHAIELNWSDDTGWPDLDFSLEVKSGETQYLKLSGSYSYDQQKSTMGSVVDRMSPVYAIPEMKLCCRYIRPENMKLPNRRGFHAEL